MFLVRSAFWLTIGFLVVAPHGVDVGATAGAIKDQAIAAGVAASRDLVVSQISVETFKAAVPAIASASYSSIDPTMQDSSKRPAPFPRPRPDWMS